LLAIDDFPTNESFFHTAIEELVNKTNRPDYYLSPSNGKFVSYIKEIMATILAEERETTNKHAIHQESLVSALHDE
jgi:hypothetical protein